MTLLNAFLPTVRDHFAAAARPTDFLFEQPDVLIGSPQAPHGSSNSGWSQVIHLRST
jgi:hypothetical protein